MFLFRTVYFYNLTFQNNNIINKTSNRLAPCGWRGIFTDGAKTTLPGTRSTLQVNLLFFQRMISNSSDF